MRQRRRHGANDRRNGKSNRTLLCVIYLSGSMIPYVHCAKRNNQDILNRITAAKEWKKKRKRKNEEIKTRIKNAPNKNILHFVWGRARAKKRTEKKKKINEMINDRVCVCVCVGVLVSVCVYVHVPATMWYACAFEVWFEPPAIAFAEQQFVCAKKRKSKNTIFLFSLLLLVHRSYIYIYKYTRARERAAITTNGIHQ